MKLKVAIFQTDIEWEAKEANILAAEAAIVSADADLVVLPEMFSTGFMPDGTLESAEPMNGYTVTRLKGISAETGKAIAGSVIISDGDKIFNRFLFVRPDGGISWYNKRHLFTYSGENERYSAGMERVVFEYKGFRIMPQVCYDLRFPVWSRNRNDYDVVIYVASWPEGRINVWDTLLRARAIENQCYAIGVNRIGTDPSATYNGHSAIVDFKGRDMAYIEGYATGITVAELDMEKLVDFRNKFRVWDDADDFTVKL